MANVSVVSDVATSKQVLDIVSWFARDDIAPDVFLRSDVVPGRRSAYEFAEAIRKKSIRRVAGARHVYYQQKMYVGSQYDFKPKAAAVAVALCRKHGWKVLIPVSLARFWLGLEIRPDDYTEFQYSSLKTRWYDDVNLTFAPPLNFDYFELSIIGQMIKLGTPRHASIQQLHDMGHHAGSGYFDKQNARDLLLADMVSGILNERELIVARAFLDAGEQDVRRCAPAEFNPNDHHGAPKVWDWSTFERDGDTLLRAARIHGHPNIGNGGRLASSSPVIWIDEAKGWCRTRSRFYRLMQDIADHDEDA